MSKRFYIIILLLLTVSLFGCSLDDSESHKIGNETVDYKEEREVNNHINVDKQVEDDKAEILNDLIVHYIDADQGDATLFQYEDYTILYDAGDWKNDLVINYLKKNDVKHIDLIIISHPHADHIGQLDKIMNSISVDEVWMTENVANTKVFQRAVNAVLESEADYYEPKAGEVFDIGSMELFVLHPDNLTGGLNEDSLSVRFTYGDISFVFTGDAYKNEELLMVECDYSLNAHFLQLGHHGSNTSSHPTFIEKVNPDYAIYSAGSNNQYGHPHNEIVNYFNDNNINLLGTDVHGTITVTTDGNKYDVLTEKDGKIAANKSKENNSTKQTNNDKNMDGNCIDINNASLEDLKKIIHIGDVRAEEIMSNRPYSSVNNLTKINGIGDGRLKDIKEQGLACVN